MPAPAFSQRFKNDLCQRRSLVEVDIGLGQCLSDIRICRQMNCQASALGRSKNLRIVDILCVREHAPIIFMLAEVRALAGGKIIVDDDRVGDIFAEQIIDHIAADEAGAAHD